MRDDAVRDALLAALDADRGDAVAQAALADWYEEQGDAPAAACLRWAAGTGRRPGHLARRAIYGSYFWELRASPPVLDDPPAQLPVPLWAALRGNDERHNVGIFKSYPSARAAYLALVAAWKSLGELTAVLQ